MSVLSPIDSFDQSNPTVSSGESIERVCVYFEAGSVHIHQFEDRFTCAPPSSVSSHDRELRRERRLRHGSRHPMVSRTATPGALL
jgi:hypothetical protein